MIANVSRIRMTTAFEIASATCSVLYVSREINTPDEPAIEVLRRQPQVAR